MRSKIEARAFLKYEIGNWLIELIVFNYFANVFSCNKFFYACRCSRWSHNSFTRLSLNFISSITILRCLCFSFNNIIGFKTSCCQSIYTNRTEAICPIHERWYIQLSVSVWTLCWIMLLLNCFLIGLSQSSKSQAIDHGVQSWTFAETSNSRLKNSTRLFRYFLRYNLSSFQENNKRNS